MSILTTQCAIKVYVILLRRSKLILLGLACPLDLCCDNCIRKQNPTHTFESIYDFIGFLDTSCGRDPILCPPDDENSDSGSTVLSKSWGDLHPGNRLTKRRQVLDDWRYDCWMRDYRFCSWGPEGVMSDSVLSELASSIKIETIDDLLEGISGWSYASKYGREVLALLKDADREQKSESQAQRVKTMRANKKRKLEDLEGQELQDLGQSVHPGPSAVPLTLVHTRMINPIVVTHTSPPTKSQPPRPRPRPTLISRPYARADIFDSLMDNSRNV